MVYRKIQYFYGVDTRDPVLYDLLININKLSADDAVDIIDSAVNLKCLEATPESQLIVEGLYLSVLVRVSLVDKYHEAEISAKDGVVYVNVRVPEILKEEVKKEVESIIRSVAVVIDIKVQKTFSFQSEV